MADQDAGAPLISGDDCLLRLFMNNDRFGEDLYVTASVKANTTKYRDDQGGNKTSHVDMRIWGWDLNVKFRYKTDRMIKAVLAYYASKMTPGAAPVVIGVMLAIQDRTAAANLPGYLFSPCVFDYDFNMGGLKERLAQGIDVWAQTFEPFVASR